MPAWSRRAPTLARTDIESPIPYRHNKHVLFGQQEGLFAGREHCHERSDTGLGLFV